MFQTDDVSAIKRLLREHRMQIDPMFPGECRQILGNKGMRLNYYRESGLTIDGIGEMLWDRGVTTERLGTVEVLDLLAAVLVPNQKQPKRKRCAHSAVSGIDAAADRARKTRLRKYECPECGQIARGTRNSSLICGLCYEMAGEIHFLLRRDALPEEILATAAEECAA